jgi:ribose transport system permease protein
MQVSGEKGLSSDAKPSASAAGRRPLAGQVTGESIATGTWRASKWLTPLQPQRISAVYVLIIVVAIFWIWLPDTFPQVSTIKSVLDQNAVDGIMGLSLVVPLACGVFDLSVGATLGLTEIVAAELLANTNLSTGIIIIICLLAALGVGIVNAAVVVTLRIDSFIGTLATSSIISALVVVFSGDNTVSSPRLLGPIQNIATASAGGITAVVLYFVVIAGLIWYVIENTMLGRQTYAVGFNARTALLSGIKVDGIRGMSLIVSAFISGMCGILVAGQISSGSPTVGPPYLLPAYALAFVGATQVVPGRFNARGTILATLLIGTGSVGLSLAGAPSYAPDIYLGLVLILAIGVRARGISRR